MQNHVTYEVGKIYAYPNTAESVVELMKEYEETFPEAVTQSPYEFVAVEGKLFKRKTIYFYVWECVGVVP